ncbi:MAG: hypothetical protein WC867_03170 [Candidatus Pacearchaeota archaeon]|jgi:hypothetical protein
MGLLKKIGLLLISILLIFTLSFAVILYGFGEVFNKEVYFDSCEKNNVYSSIEFQLKNESMSEFFILEGGVKPFVQDKIVNFLDYMKNERDDLDLKIKVNKTLLYKQFGEQIKDIPLCPEEVKVFNKENICKPINMGNEEFIDKILDSQNMSGLITDSIDLKETFNQDGNLDKNLKNLRQIYPMYQKILLALFILSIFFILMIIFMDLNTIKPLLRTLGIVLIIVSINLYTFSSILISTYDKESAKMISEFSSEIDLTMFIGLVRDLFVAITLKIKPLGIGFLIIGLIFVILSILIKTDRPIIKRKKDIHKK